MWQILEAFALAGVVAVGTWKITGMMIERGPDRRRPALNPARGLASHRDFRVGDLQVEVNKDNGFGQWEMAVTSNGVVVGHTYGDLPLPNDETLRRKAKIVAAHG